MRSAFHSLAIPNILSGTAPNSTNNAGWDRRDCSDGNTVRSRYKCSFLTASLVVEKPSSPDTTLTIVLDESNCCTIVAAYFTAKIECGVKPVATRIPRGEPSGS